MASQAGSRKQITYAHKRTRSRPPRVVSASSPLPETDDPDHYTSHAELSQRLLKRARRSSNPEPFSSKKLKPSGVTPAGSQSGSPSQYETPHPSALTEEQKFKLNSSRGLPVHPDQFSPLPVARRITSRTASRNLKENASLRGLKRGKLLDSPFNSRPSSAASSPQKTQPVLPSPVSTEHSTHKSFKRTLSDTHYNPNIPQSASTTNSPTHAHSPVRARRPSAPSPLRPGNWLPKETALGSFDFNFHSAFVNPFSLPSSVNDTDFNRPPSSLSFYGDTESQFFDEVQGSSTPATKKRAYTLGSAVADEDDEHLEPDLTITQDAMDIDVPRSAGMKLIPTRERSPWLSDSLISPPVSQEWKIPPQEGAYTHAPSQDVDMYDEISLGLGLAPDFRAIGPASENAAEEPASHADEPNAGDRELKNMFDGLGLATKNRFLNNRTRSLDSAEADDEVHPKPKGRNRQNTIRASDFKNSVAPTRRTRSGTVIGPPTTIQRVRSLNGPEDAVGIGEVNEDEELNSWCADGWVVAAPPSPVVTRKRPGMRKGAVIGSPDRPDELDMMSKGSGLLPSPVLHFKKKSGSTAVAKDIVMEEDEEDDELLLKPGFNVWE
ncbi:hypothetical protein B0H13DRAFT_2413701 [Mycena leptocephala]|nr:hypothetical protein B0H13DRAFT_2413701 [Mycena leptocephala]